MTQLRHLQHVKSSTILDTGLPKLPVATDLLYGEIAVNYAAGAETLTLRNSSNQLTKFRPNTNVFVENLQQAVSDDVLVKTLTVPNANSYQDFNITFLDKYEGNFDLSNLVSHIVTTFYDVSSLHIMLNIAKGDDSSGKATNFIINSEVMAELMSSSSTPLSKKSLIIGFTKYDIYFVAGDSTAMSGIEIIWDNNTKAITVRFVYLDSIYRLNGDEI